MHDNVDELEDLLRVSQRHGVNHQMTLLSTGGDGRHDRAQRLPAPGIGARLLELKRALPALHHLLRLPRGDRSLPRRATCARPAGRASGSSTSITWAHVVALHREAAPARRQPAARSLERWSPARLRALRGDRRRCTELHDRLPRLRRGDERRAAAAQLARVLRRLRQRDARAGSARQNKERGWQEQVSSRPCW